MGQGYEHHSIQHHHHISFHRRNMFFLPIFCRLSIKDINLNNNSRRKDPAVPAADEPSSPKVSCMGQVKRNNRVIGFPTAVTTVATHHHHNKYSKLRKLFSSKTLLPPSTATNPGSAVAISAASGGGRSGSKSCRSSREVCLNNLRRLKLNNNDDGNGKCGGGQGSFVKLVNIGELDPPLPVVKKVAPPGVDRDEVNLWKRRFSGAPLKSLQIEPIHLPNTKSQPPTV